MRRVHARQSTSRKGLALALLVSLAFTAASGVAVYNMDAAYMASKVNLVTYVPERVIAGSESSVLILAFDDKGESIGGRYVNLYLEQGVSSELLWSGQTDAEGSASAVFTAPAWSGQAKIVARSGSETLETTTLIDDTVRIIFTTDKPVYQPGQTIHIRLASFAGTNPLPIDSQVLLEVIDPNGDKIFKKNLEVNDYGIASYDLALSDQLVQGTYTLKGTVGERSVTKAVLVKEYVLPKFRVDLLGMRDWYLVDESIDGVVSSEYFFGQLVQGTVKLEARMYYGVWVEVYNATGTLVDGEFPFVIPAVMYAIGVPAAGWNGYLQLNITVTDTGGHSEKRSKVIAIAPQSLSLSVLTDSCVLGEESTFFVVVRTPDGAPVSGASVSTKMKYDDGSSASLPAVHTDARGVAEVVFVYDGQVSAEFRASMGSMSGSTKMEITGGSGIKITTDKAEYEVGEVGVFNIVYRGSSMTANVYYDVVSRGYVVDRGVLQMVNSRATLEVQMTPDLEPFAQVRVYKIESEMDVSRDAVTFGVGTYSPLSVEITSDNDSYKPRDTVGLSFSVTNQGEPILAALGIAAVDEAVFEVESSMQGFEEIIFGLDAEFVVPQYLILSYVYAGAPSLPSETDNVVSELDAARMAGTLSQNLADAEALKAEAVESYWLSLFLVAGVGIVALFGWAARSGMREIKILLVVIMVPVLLLAGFVAYAQTLGFGGSSAPSVPRGGQNWEQMGAPPDALFDRFDFGFGAADDDTSSGSDTTYSGADSRPTVVRSYFPETWYWNPCLITDESGEAAISLTAPDSITAWRIDVVASSMDGQMGTGSESVTVFQPFFVDPDIPVSVVRGDTFPLKVQVYNYLGSAQTVTATLVEEPWFTLVSPSTQVIEVPANYVSSVTFTIIASKVGWHTVTLDASSPSASDAIVKPIKIVPDGMKVETLYNGQVTEGRVMKTLELDPARIEDSENAWVKLQGGLEAVLLEGVEAYIQFVTGCGEQSLSMLSIDILAYDTVRKLGTSPERLFEYESIVNQGIQHELMYLVEPNNNIGRGIVWFPGDQDVHPWLTSWGLIAFQDAVNAGFGLDEDIIDDMQAWLMSIQNSDGSWQFPDWGIYEFNNPLLKSKKIAATSYIARGLMYSGVLSTDSHIEKAVAYVQGHVQEVWDDPYSLALSLLVMQMGSGSTTLRGEAAAQLDSLKHDENGTYYWSSQTNLISDPGFGGVMMPDMWGGRSSARVIETTGYAAMALHGEYSYFTTVEGAVKYLLDHRQSLGGWYSTQDTIVAFHTLNTVSGSSTIEEIVASVSVGGTEVFSVEMGEFNRDVTYYVDLRPYLVNTTNVSVTATGEGTLLYTVYLEQYIPWPDEPPASPFLTLEVTYDATHIQLTDSVSAHMYLLYSGPAPMLKMILVDLRAPMGLSFVQSEFDALRDAGVISSYDTNERQVVVYLTDVASGVAVEFDYALVPQMIIKSTAQDISAWDMYDPNAMRTEVGPVQFEVE